MILPYCLVGGMYIYIYVHISLRVRIQFRELTKSIRTSSLKITIQFELNAQELIQYFLTGNFPLISLTKTYQYTESDCFHDQWMKIFPFFYVPWIDHYYNCVCWASIGIMVLVFKCFLKNSPLVMLPYISSSYLSHTTSACSYSSSDQGDLI